VFKIFIFVLFTIQICVSGGGKLEGEVVEDGQLGEGEVGDEVRTYNFIKPK